MSNELKTEFIFQTAEADRRIELTQKRLVGLDKQLNSFGLNPTFGKGISSQFDALGKKVNQFEANLKKLGSTDLKALGNDLLKQAQIEKVLEQTKRATVQTLTEEVKLERQKLGLQRDELKLQQQINGLKKKPDADLKSALAEIKKYQQQQINGEREVTKSIEREAKLQADAKTRAGKKTANDFIASLSPSGAGGGGFGNSFANRVGAGSFAGSSASVVLGGLAGGAAIAGIGILKSEISSLIQTAEDLSVTSIKLAGDFEQTTNSLAVFAGGTANARAELAAIDKIALNTPGLGLKDAEIGYQRLRALNFEAKISQNLIKGLGTQRVLSGASADAVDRVITNIIQLKTGAGTAADVRQTIGQLPTLLPVFQKAFGTQDFGDINKIFKTDPQALQKFTDELAKAQTAQVGLNVSIEKGHDALTQAGRLFGEPILDPLTKDVQDLTKFLNENQDTFARWGQTAGDALRGVSEAFVENRGEAAGAGLARRITLGILTAGISEGVIGNISNFSELGKQSREAENQSKPVVSLLDGSKVKLDETTNTIRLISDITNKVPSLNDKLETKKAIENAKKVADSLAELSVKTSIDSVSQNLEVEKARISLNFKDNALEVARQTAALEISALRQQISLSDQLTKVKTQNLTNEEAAAGRGLMLSQENAANVSKLNNQILLTQINSQKQIQEESKKLADDFRDSLVSLKSSDNPLVKMMFDIETATERAQKKFGIFGDAVVKKIADIEKANLTKALNLQTFENGFEALKFRQEAFKLSNTPERQFADFQRTLERVNQTADFVSSDNDLSRRTAEANYYTNLYNPNNPKSFADFNKRNFNDDLSDVGLQIRNAITDIGSLQNIGLEDTGISGKGAIADKILSLIPSRDELLKRLNSPFASVRGDADFLLRQQSSALFDKKAFERQKFSDFLEDQKFQGFAKPFAKQQIGLINDSNLTDAEKAQRRLSVADALGNDLDPSLKRQKIQDYLRVAEEKDKLVKEAMKIAADTKKAVEQIARQLAERGIKIDGGGETPAVNVNVEIKDSPTTKSTVQRANPSDTAKQMDLSGTYFEQSKRK